METSLQTVVVIGFGTVTFLSLSLLVALYTSLYKRKLAEKENKIQVLENEKQVDLFKATVEAEEKQKAKIASDLHDEVIPTIAPLGRSLDRFIGEHAGNYPPLDELKKIVAGLEEAAQSIRGIAHGISPKMLGTFGLLKVLEIYVAQLDEATGAAAEFQDSTDLKNGLPFSESEQLNIYRICLEVLNNLQKHAQYDYLTVNAENTGESLTLLFSHDGRGITNTEIEAAIGSGTGLGLKSLRSRLLILNASINYYKDPGVAHIKLTFPLKLHT